MGNREIAMLRGKGLGGSTQTNFQLWSLGGRDEFDAWANAVDDPVWGFDSILENIKKVMLETVRHRETSYLRS
jgi:choline dehydrogenase-like flavoprotein